MASVAQTGLSNLVPRLRSVDFVPQGSAMVHFDDGVRALGTAVPLDRPHFRALPVTAPGTAPIRHHVAGLSCGSCTQIRLGDAAHTSLATSRWCLSSTRRWRMT